jgi:hypothetical protein
VENETSPSKATKNKPAPSDLWSGGLIAIGLIILQDFLNVSAPDRAAYTSIFAFAIAIPILTCNLLTNFARKESTKKAPDYEILFYIIGVLAAFVGITAAFWHACWIAAIIFTASSVLACAVYLLASYRR